MVIMAEMRGVGGLDQGGSSGHAVERRDERNI